MKILKVASFLCLVYTLTSPTYANVIWEKVNLPKLYVTSVQNTNFGVIVGEFDSRAFLNPYNGISITKNFGDSWQDLGLAKRGVTDIFYHKEDRSIYATTYYSVFDNEAGRNTIGLYISYDAGQTWQHLGPDVSATKVIAFDNTIILGTFSHGLWYSNDNGSTWNQRLGSGYFGPRIKLIKQVGTTIYAYDDVKTYRSTDNGSSWEIFLPLGDEKIADIEGTTDIIFAGTSNNRGLFYSKDKGNTWVKDSFWNDKSIHSIKYFPITKAFYLGTSNGVWVTADNGKTWQNTQAPFSKQTLGISWVFSNNSKLFASVQQEGLYKYNIPSTVSEARPYFAFPWKQTYPNETLDSISAFFDHAYPLLGYSLYSEPSSDSTTTTNFYGISLPVPDLFYSSHDGTDFALKYGTEVKAVASGVAGYDYDKNGLGYFIRLSHQNGYQSVYGHLQPHPDKPPTTIHEGDIIGKVGMSGNTSGPHLHFTVVHDLDADGDFTNDIPQGKTDPFGWQNSLLPDPWDGYYWKDAAGTHVTESNVYLWKDPTYAKNMYLDGQARQTSVLGVNFEFKNTQEVYSASINPLPSKAVKLDGKNPLPNASFDFTVTDTFGESEDAVDVELEIEYSAQPLANIDEASLMLLSKSKNDIEWKKLNATIDQENNKITATVQSGLFLLAGDLIDKLPPITTIKIHGRKVGNKYTQTPVLELTAIDTDYQSPVQSIFYKLNDSEYIEYTEPMLLPLDSPETTYLISFRSMDIHQNLETEKTIQIDLDNIAIRSGKIRVTNTNFVTQGATN